jgi:transcriptional regulator with XRE-family HTH domain
MTAVNVSAIASLRRIRGMSVADLAAASQITPKGLRAVEAGRKEPSAELCYRLAASLGTEPSVISPGLPGPADARTIRDRRRAAGIKVGVFAARAGCSVAHLMNVEAGAVRPSGDLLRRVARLLGCGTGDLDPPESQAASATPGAGAAA